MSVRIAVLADVHGNLHALDAVLAAAERAGCQALWVAGDLVGYGAFPAECLARLRQREALAIRGDMDGEVLAAARGELPADAAEEKVAALLDAARALSDEGRAWLAALPKERSVAVEALAVHLVHGSPADPQEHLWPDTPAERLRELAGGERAALVVCGHTHRAMEREAGGVRFLNPGAVGRAADGDPRAGWARLDVDGGVAVWESFRVAYDVEAAARAIGARGLPELVQRMIREGRGMKALKGEG